MKPLFTLLAFISFFCMVSCKPTEKNYKAAYDAALGKREASITDLGVTVPKGAIQQVDGPQLKKVDGVDVYVLNQRISPTENDKKLPGSYNIAVGSYQMITNCKAQSENLRNEGFDAFPSKDTSGKFYTIAASFSDLSEAISFYKKFTADKNRVYVGLPEAPVIIYSPL